MQEKKHTIRDQIKMLNRKIDRKVLSVFGVTHLVASFLSLTDQARLSVVNKDTYRCLKGQVSERIRCQHSLVLSFKQLSEVDRVNSVRYRATSAHSFMLLPLQLQFFTGHGLHFWKTIGF